MICEINLDGERGEHEELTRRNGQFEIEEFRKLGNLSGFHSSVFAFPSFPPPSPFSSLRICASAALTRVNSSSSSSSSVGAFSRGWRRRNGSDP